MKRLLPHPLLTPMLALVWLLLNNSVAPGQIVLGLLLGWAIPLVHPAFLAGTGAHSPLAYAAAFCRRGAARHRARAT